MNKTAGLFTRQEIKRSPKKVFRSLGKMKPEALWRVGLKGVRDINQQAYTPLMPPNSIGTEFYFLGTSPTIEEDRKGTPFERTTPIGELLYPKLKRHYWNRSTFAHIVGTTLPANRKDTNDVYPYEIECFRPTVQESILDTKPEAIFTFGLKPLQWLLPHLKNPAFALRGKRFPLDLQGFKTWVYPLVDLAVISENEKKRDKRYFEDKEIKQMGWDLKNAFNQIDRGLTPPKLDSTAPDKLFKGTYCSRDADEIIKHLKYLNGKGPLSVDIETTHLRPYSDGYNMLSIAFGTEDHTVAFPVHHPRHKWGRDQERIDNAIVNMLVQNPCVFHNFAFDVEHLAYVFSKELIRNVDYHDTMQLAYTMDMNSGTKALSLDFLCYQEFGINLKSQSNVDRTKLITAKMGELLRYNALDVKYTAKLFKSLKQKVEMEGLIDVYHEQLDRVKTLTYTQIKGINVCHKTTERLKKEFERKLAEADKEVLRSKEAITFKKRYGPLSVSSDQQILKLYKEVIGGLPEGHRSVDETTLKKYGGKIGELILERRKSAKLLSTYIMPLVEGSDSTVIHPDGLIHTNYNTMNTNTGRLSCVAAWTPVDTLRGRVRIDQIRVGDLVKTHRGRYKLVTNTIIKGTEQMYDVHFCNGKVLTCTNSHRFLTSSNKWKSLGDIRNAAKYEMVPKQAQQKQGIDPLPEPSFSYVPRDCGRGWYQTSECLVRSKKWSETRGVKSTQIRKVFSIKARQQKPNERTHSSKSQRGLRRSKRLCYKGCRRQEILHTPGNYGRDVRNARKGFTKGYPRTPYRWGWDEQRPKQLSLMHRSRSCYDTLKGSRGEVTKIEKIIPRHSSTVYDITVADDHSYSACGVFNHNSSDPNSQNFPKRNKILKVIRKCIVPPPNHYILSIDYGQIEYRVMGMTSEDKTVLDSLWNNYDVHMVWAKKLAKKLPDIVAQRHGHKKDPMKEFRGDIKNQFVFPGFYGSKLASIARSLTCDPDDIQDEWNAFWREFKGIERWHKEVTKFYDRNHFVETLSGRRRNGPLSYNEMINAPIQGCASDIVVDAMNRLSVEAYITGEDWLQPVMNIHDDLTFFVPCSILDDAVKYITGIMLEPRSDWQWARRCPLLAEAEYGKNWHDMEEIGKFESTWDKSA